MAKILSLHRVPLTLDTDRLEWLDEYRRAQPDMPSRAETIRRLMDAQRGVQAARPTQVER